MQQSRRPTRRLVRSRLLLYSNYGRRFFLYKTVPLSAASLRRTQRRYSQRPPRMSRTLKCFECLVLIAWQDYLRVQEANTSSVNLINASVDYLVRLQESMSDFFWHYSSIEQIDIRGREAFMVAILVGKQVFASLTEMIQGPCTGNQLALTHSRLWDAVSGFFHIFANLQMKLSQVSNERFSMFFLITSCISLAVMYCLCQDPEQMEFLRELMDLQKEMVTLLLSMLEGNVLNGPIGKQMVDTLALCSQNVEEVLQFFTTFLKYSEIVAGVSFKVHPRQFVEIFASTCGKFLLFRIMTSMATELSNRMSSAKCCNHRKFIQRSR